MSDPNIIIQRQIQDLQDGHERLRKADVPGVAGTWTPTLVGSGTAGTFTYAATTAGNWTRIGDTVFLRGRINITTVTVAPTGNLSIGGLPIASATVTSGIAGALVFIIWSLFNIGGGASVALGGLIGNAATTAALVISLNNGGAGINATGAVANISANTDVWFTGQYQV